MANVVGTFAIEYETASGDTQNATQALLPLRWDRARWTLRRRAPHEVSIVVPVTAPHVPSDFVPHRELRLKRDGAYVAWGAGFMGAAQIGLAGDEWGPIELPGYGNAAALELFTRGTCSSGFVGLDFGIGFDTDSVIDYLLDHADHGSGGDWFPAAQRSLGAGAISLYGYSPRSRTALAIINEVTAAEGWSWRAGITAAGLFSFAASATVDTDRSASLHLIDRVNCRITAVAQDDSRILSSVTLFCRTPPIRTQLNGATLAGATSITVDSTAGMDDQDSIVIGAGATSEERPIQGVTSATVLDMNAGFGGLTNAYADNTEVNTVTKYFRKDTRAAAASVAQTYHDHAETVVNDQLRQQGARQEYGDALLDTYDAVQRSATVETTDQALIAAILDAGLEPGDSVKLTSAHRYLSAWYAGTTVRVQEMALELEPGGCRKVTLQVGDPRLDDLGVLERKIASLQLSQAADQS